jgi:GntP family gluconate:H+ symporter
MIVSHTNDSYFWVVTKFSGMNVRQGLKLQTVGTLVSGLAGAIVLLIIGLFCI